MKTLDKVFSGIAVIAVVWGLGFLSWVAYHETPTQQQHPTSAPASPTKFTTLLNPTFVPGPFDSLRVGPFTYTVKWVETGFLCGTEPVQGCTSYPDRTITIEKQSPMSTRSIVLHETMHAVAEVYQNPYEATPLSGEEWAQTSPVFLEVLRDNPKLIKYLTEDK